MIGNFLEINLSSETVKNFKLGKNLYKKFIGGKGIGAYLLFKYTKKGIDGLSPENPLIFLSGPLTGSGFPTSGRMVIVSKSPLTNTYADSHAGGYFGNELKKLGYDGIVLIGKSNNLSYLYIDNNSVEFRNAKKLKNNLTSETVDKIRKETNDNARIACIGPAGENMSLISSIMIDKDTDKTRAGIAGRSGLGAVMGSKNVKAIAIKGNLNKNFINPDLFNIGKSGTLNVIKSTEFMKIRKKYGSANLVGPMNKEGFLPTNNFKSGNIDNGENLYCESMNKHKSRNTTCFACPINCGQIIKSRNNKEVKIEYESVALLGSNNGIRNFMDLTDACLACNELGLDSMSAGGVIGFAMECKEKGLLNTAPDFGDSIGQVELLEKIAYRKGIGEIFADGVKRASEIIGNDSYKFAIHIKGLEMAGYEPRTSWGMALAYATADRGACHQRCWTVNTERAGGLSMFSFDDKPKFVSDSQNERAAAYSILVCDFLPFNQKDIVKAFEGVTGINFSEDDYLEAGERIWNLIRLFNIREGFTRKDDTLPYRMFNEYLELPKGIYEIDKVIIEKKKFDKALDDYYEYRGWTSNGYPSLNKLKELEIDNFVLDDNICSYLKKLYQDQNLLV